MQIQLNLKKYDEYTYLKVKEELKLSDDEVVMYAIRLLEECLYERSREHHICVVDSDQDILKELVLTDSDIEDGLIRTEGQSS